MNKLDTSNYYKINLADNTFSLAIIIPKGAMSKKKIILGLILIIFAIISKFIFQNQIILKYITSSAKNIGKEKKVRIYTNGTLNQDIKLYSVSSYFDGKPAKYDLLIFQNLVSRNIISINYDYKFIGFPTSSNEKDYKIIFGNLYQSDMGALFIPINDEVKGLGFDPKLNFKNNIIKFKLPFEKFGIDSIRIEK